MKPDARLSMWFLTSIHVDESKMLRHPKGEIKLEKFTRTFGFYHRTFDALAAVKENRMNMHECLYNYLVMERIAEGIHSICDDEEWFKWGKKGWTPCNKPEWAKGMVNWALG